MKPIISPYPYPVFKFSAQQAAEPKASRLFALRAHYGRDARDPI
ncbi:MAG TPA: hypothetical protein VIF64_15440 [Pyrinomonadaceae bacterium]